MQGYATVDVQAPEPVKFVRRSAWKPIAAATQESSIEDKPRFSVMELHPRSWDFALVHLTGPECL
jgi:hypothetical protein